MLSRASWEPSKIVQNTGGCEISSIKLQRYTDTGPRPVTRPQARANGKFEISEIRDNETPSVVFLFSRVPVKTFLVSTVELTCRAIYETGDYSCACTQNYIEKNCEIIVGE